MLLLLLHSERITTVTQQAQNNTQQAQNSAAGAQPRDAQVYCLGDLLQPLIADNDAAIAAMQTGQPRGPQTGIPALDKGLGGFLAPGLHILQASPGAGKTTMALQIASDCQHPALYISAEMPTLESFKRLIARQTSTFLGNLNGQIASRNLEDLAHLTIGKLPHLAIMDATAGMAGVDLIRQAAEAICAAANAKAVLIVLDSLHVWARGLLRGMGSDYEIISEGT
jgi:replicative DNA helicase